MKDELGAADVPAGFLRQEPAAVAAVEAAVDRALGARSLNLGDFREDVRQETLRRLVISFRKGQFRGESALSTYVHKVAHGAAIDHWRSLRRRLEDPADDHPKSLQRATPPVQMASVERGEKRALIESLLARIGSPCRELLIRIYFEEVSHAVIARDLGKSEDAVKVQAHRCRREAGRLLTELSVGAFPVTPGAPSSPKRSAP